MKNKPSFLRPTPALFGILLAVSVLFRLFPYILSLFGLSIDPGTTVYPWNFSPLPALCLFGAAYFPRKAWAYLVPLGAFLLGDLGIWALTGRADWAFYPAQPLVYGCIALKISLGFLLRKHRSVGAIAATGLISETLFFIITNFGVWAFGSGTIYPMTVEGLSTCYIAAIPFFRNSLISLAVFCPMLFGSVVLWEKSAAPLDAVSVGGESN